MRIARLTSAAAFLLVHAAAAAGVITMIEGQIPLFSGINLDGWVHHADDENADPAQTWQIRPDGVLHCTGKPVGYLRTEQAYARYRLTLEWRWPREAGRGGVLLHVQDGDEVWPRSIETQLSAGDAGDFWVFHGVNFDERENPERMRTRKREETSEKPVGQWNRLEVTCTDKVIEVRVNGVLQNRATHPALIRGYIALQSDGSPIEFRNIALEAVEPPESAESAHASNRGAADTAEPLF
jgi:hypothetical protein